MEWTWIHRPKRLPVGAGDVRAVGPEVEAVIGVRGIRHIPRPRRRGGRADEKMRYWPVVPGWRCWSYLFS